MPAKPFVELAQAIAEALPALRRYARALSGTQPGGDAFAEATLERLLENPAALEGAGSVKLKLFALFHQVWAGAGAPVGLAETGLAETGLAARAQALMAGLTPLSREALLLRAIEGFAEHDIAAILQTPPEQVAALLAAAEREMAQSVTGRVLVIEDEAIIAMDISEIVSGLGHAVTGVARTRTGAVALAERDPPDLILADILLADQSSGMDAVNDIFARIGPRPVIFITAFPEKMLTGTRPEPAFLIPKPYSEDQLRSAVSQAMFFASTETLGG